MRKSDLEKRMRQYEAVSKTRLTRRTPVIIRIDGKAHHTFTRGFNKPFDDIYMNSMQNTMKYLCENIQGTVLGYTQSDEITLVLVDYKKITSDAWFDNEVQKICSISASMATAAFNRFYGAEVQNFGYECCEKYLGDKVESTKQKDYERYLNIYIPKIGYAQFDARCFNIPKEEVANEMYWRQVDAIRNSIQSLGQSYFSSKQLKCKNVKQIKEMLLTEKSVDWNELSIVKQRGCCCKKVIVNPEIKRMKWEIDYNIPEFIGDNREYINDLIFY